VIDNGLIQKDALYIDEIKLQTAANICSLPEKKGYRSI
jgi:hypothetical protein